MTVVEPLYTQIVAIFAGIHVYAIGKYANGHLVLIFMMWLGWPSLHERKTNRCVSLPTSTVTRIVTFIFHSVEKLWVLYSGYEWSLAKTATT